MQNGDIITVKRKSDDAVLSIGDYLKEGGVFIFGFAALTENTEVIAVKRKSDGAVFSVGDYLKRNGNIKIIGFDYQEINDSLIAVFSDNRIGLNGLRKNEIAKKQI